MIAPMRKSQAGLFQANASSARIGSPTLTLLASKRWTSSAHNGTGFCAKSGYGRDQSIANKEKTRKHLLHDICALLLAIACRKRALKSRLRSSPSNNVAGPQKDTS